jgi:glyoxylase-like metal-dependent hydrolase (beta-lactamase superfamily II)
VSLERLDDVTSVVLAPNPSPMTLEGTNTYLLGVPGSGEVVIVDPGPDLLDHRRAVEDTAGRLDAAPAAVVVTHHHVDHAQAAGWAEGWGVPLYAFTPSMIPAGPAEPLRDGDVLRRAEVTIEAVHTPGHCSDHICLRIIETDVVLTGDHMLGRGTTVVAWPDGDMAAYLASLRRVGELGASALYPGHGPVLEDPVRAVEEYLAHRLEREQQVLSALRAGDRSPAEVVTRVYADVDPVLHPAAERSVRAHLAKLVAEGAATGEGDQYRA